MVWGAFLLLNPETESQPCVLQIVKHQATKEEADKEMLGKSLSGAAGERISRRTQVFDQHAWIVSGHRFLI